MYISDISACTSGVPIAWPSVSPHLSCDRVIFQIFGRSQFSLNRLTVYTPYPIISVWDEGYSLPALVFAVTFVLIELLTIRKQILRAKNLFYKLIYTIRDGQWRLRAQIWSLFNLLGGVPGNLSAMFETGSVLLTVLNRHPRKCHFFAQIRYLEVPCVPNSHATRQNTCLGW